MAKLIIILEKCVNNGNKNISCPYADSERTPGAGYAMDYFCTLMPDSKAEHGFKKTSGYVEWDREINPIPLWCPIMDVEEKVLKIFES
jgi:hypothetical protein